MIKISWKLFKTSFPFICYSCRKLLWETRTICEGCGCTLTIRETTKKDYKEWQKNG